MAGRHAVKHWARTQALIALSSGEAELYGIVKASAELLGMGSIYRDLGESKNSSVIGDASAALGMVQRMGLGKVRHLHTNMLWVQEKAANKEIHYEKGKRRRQPSRHVHQGPG